MIRSLAFFALPLLATAARAQQLAIPPESAGNMFECFNSDGDGASCARNQHRSGSWITGNSDGVDDVAVTAEGSVIIPTGSFRKHIVDYRALFNQGDDSCGPAPIVETPHHAPFVLEFSRYFRTRATYVDYGLTKGWKDNHLFLLNITNGAGFRQARFEVPSGAVMNWVDANSNGNWVDDSSGMQSMVLTLTDEPGNQHLVTDRWGGKYHFRPNTSTRPNLQYLIDWLEDENQNRITLTYDALGYLTQAADGFGRSLTYIWNTAEFNGTRHIAWVVLPDGRQLAIQYFFDTQRSYSLTYPNGDVASYGRGHDADENFYFFNDPLGEPGTRKQRVYTYRNGPTFQNETGRVRGIKDESGHVQLIRSEDPNTPKITIEYDDGRGFAYDCAFGGLNAVVTNLRTGAITTNEWQLNGGLLKTKIDALGGWITADYDDARALRTLYHDLGPTTESWTYTALNRVADYVDKNGNVTHHDYDVRGNLIRRTYADASYEEWTRHASGRVTAYRNRNGQSTTYQYDTRGNVTEIVLPAQPSEANPVVAYQYDVNGLVQSKTDPVGRVTTYQYDALGRRTRTDYADGTFDTLAYGTMNLPSSTDPVGTAGLIVSRTDRDGHTTTYEFGVNDRLVREAGAPGEILHAYDAQDRYVARTENGDVETYGYDLAYRRTSVAQVADATHTLTTTFQYDLLDRVVESVDPHGFTTELTYSGAGRVASRTRQIHDTDVSFVANTYDDNGNVLTETDGGLRSFTYDSNNRRLRAYDPAPFDANYVEWSYAPEGQVLSHRDQEGHTSLFAYTNRGKLSQETDPSGVVLQHTYNLDDTLQRTDKPATLGQTSYTYDGGGRPSTRMIVVDGGINDIITTAVHDGSGHVMQSTDGEGGLSMFDRDARGRVTSVTDALGEETLTDYFDDGSPFDARLAPGQGSAVSVTNANGSERTTVYDGLGRVIREIDEAGKSTVYAHDVLQGGLEGTLRTDRLGHASSEFRDGLGRLVKTTDELGGVTTWRYDAQGNLFQLTNARGKDTFFTTDALGRRTSTNYGDPGDFVSASYYANGWLQERIDQQGNHTQYTYDAAGRPLTVVYQDSSTDSFTYDAGGRLIQATSGQYGNSVSRGYDRADRVVIENTAAAVQIAYDRRSKVKTITTPSGRVFQRTYTARGELDTVRLGASVLVDNDYDPAGNLLYRAFGNGTSSTWSYEAHGWPQSVLHAQGTTEILSLTFGYDPEGRRRRQRNLSQLWRTERYQYDEAGRLVSYQGKTPPFSPFPFDPDKGVTKLQAWTLDEVGNWSQFRSNGTVQQRTHSDANVLLSIGTLALTYKRGCLESDGAFLYGYDYNDRLRYITDEVTGDPIAEYAYDALGRRVRRTAIDKSTISQRRFVYCYFGDQVVELREEPAPNEPHQFVAAFALGSELDEPLVMVRPGKTFYYHPNAMGSTMALTDETGAVVERYEYDPYGLTKVYNGQWIPVGDTSTKTNPFTFQGRENDSEAGLIFFRGRSLSPKLGRFLQRNPAGFAGGVNLYSATSLVNERSPFGTND